MGRSRGNFHADEDPSQRSRRKKNASNGDNLDSATPGQGSSEGKRALYHCNYCNKDISGRTRIKCAACSDFDLCIECFSVGAEVHPHKSCHPYRVMDILSFPIICPEWNADEEILLLEGIEMYGVGNWAEVAEHVGTKSKAACIEHYRAAYLSSPCFPLPDMTHANGKNRKELLAMAKGQLEDKKVGELQLKEESPFSPSRVKVEDTYKNGPSGRLSSTSMAGAKVNKKASNNFHSKDQEDLPKVEDNTSGQSFSGSKPKAAKFEAPMVDSSGYNTKRQEFDPEYDNDAEQLLADMEFKENDAEEERELKLRVLRIYGKRLDERKRRKEFILERELLLPSQFRKDLSREEKELCQRYDVYMRFHSKEEHDELIKVVISEQRIQKRIQQLEEARGVGCRSSADADRYLEQQKRRKTMNGTHNDSSQAMHNSQDSLISFYSESLGAYPTSGGQAILLGQTDTENLSDSGANLLSEYEKQLCREMKLPPYLYLKMQEDMTTQIMSGGITKKSEAHSFFQLEPTKVDRVYDMLLKKGIVQQP